MKIKRIRVYQPVHFEGQARTNFVCFKTEDRTVPVVQVKQDEFGVIVWTEKCAVRVGWPNISSMELDVEDYLKSLAGEKPESKVKKA